MMANVSKIICLVFISALIAQLQACTDRHSWSQEEIDNSKHFFASLEAKQAATRLINKGPSFGVIPDSDIQQIIKLQKIALQEARLVKDSVLEKAHPELREHFRFEYQKGLELVVKSLDAPNVPAQITGSTLLDQWVEWINAHRKEIKIPKG